MTYMILDCANCKNKVRKTYLDKVWNKPVCKVCMLQAIAFGIRFEFDYEEIH